VGHGEFADTSGQQRDRVFRRILKMKPYLSKTYKPIVKKIAEI
jgi:hypothetical protein